MKILDQGFRFIFLLGTIITTVVIHHQLLNNVLGFNSLIYLVLFPIFSILTLIWPFNIFPSKISNFSISPIIYISAFFIGISISYTYNQLNDHSPIILSTGYMDDDSFCIDFKQNGNYRIRYHSIMQSFVKFGKYRKKGNLIILKKEIEIGRFRLNDTMRIEGKMIKNGLYNNYKGEKFKTMPITGYKERCNW